MAGLFRELVEQGYEGSYARVRDTLLRLLPEGRKTPPCSLPDSLAPVLSRQAAFFFLRQPGKLETDEQETLKQLRQLHPEIDLAKECMANETNQFGLWQPWQPEEVARFFSTLTVPWWIAGGWALDLFLGAQTGYHFIKLQPGVSDNPLLSV